MKKLTRALLLLVLATSAAGSSGCNSTVYAGVGVSGPWYGPGYGGYGHHGPYRYPYPVGGGVVVIH